MSKTLIEDFYLFNSLSRSGRVEFISEKIRSLGLIPGLQYFHSCFGEGCNVIVNIDDSRPRTIITAHYDGESFFDNTGGVFALIYLANRCKQIKSKAYTILFTDQEETFQQGIYYYTKQQILEDNTTHINVDGYGIGDNVYSLLGARNFIYQDNRHFFLTDNLAFDNFNGSSISLFSSFDIDYLKLQEVHDTSLVYSRYIDNDFFTKNFTPSMNLFLNELLWQKILLST